MTTITNRVSAPIAVAVLALGCNGGKPSEAESPAELHDRLYTEGCDLINPYMRLHDVASKTADSAKARRDLEDGIARLQQVVVMNPGNWPAFWTMGKAHQALDRSQLACDCFSKAYALQRENADVAREYMFECLNLGRSEKAVELAQAALDLEPGEPGLLANLALALLIDAQVDRALSVVEQSLAKAPSDQVTHNLKRIIGEVKAGQRSQPRKYGDILGVEK